MKIADNDLVFAWYGLPQYAARCMQAAREAIGVRIPVIGTRAAVPILGMEEILEGDVLWIEETKLVTWSDLGLPIPKIFIVTGWAYPILNHLAEQVRRSGGHVVVMVDNCWKGSIRQLFGTIYFRLILRRKFSYALVPGRSASKLLRILGMPENKIQTGLYGADVRLFSSGEELIQRTKTIVYVGQYIERKGILPFVDAFIEFARTHPDWNLELYGSGPLMGSFIEHPQVSVNPFVQPSELAPLLRRARALVLPSYEEHWGLVVHEAALSGCALLLSEKTGSGTDLGREENSVTFKPGCHNSIVCALNRFSAWTDADLTRAQSISLQLADDFGPIPFTRSIQFILNEL